MGTEIAQFSGRYFVRTKTARLGRLHFKFSSFSITRHASQWLPRGASLVLKLRQEIFFQMEIINSSSLPSRLNRFTCIKLNHSSSFEGFWVFRFILKRKCAPILDNATSPWRQERQKTANYVNSFRRLIQFDVFIHQLLPIPCFYR